MKIKKTLTTLGLAALLTGTAMLCSCNEDSNHQVYTAPVNLAVSSFSIKSGLGEQELDTVFFSIDLQHGIIFNADSLRKGTDLSRIVANITFANNVSGATVIMSGGTRFEGEVDYQKSPTDTLDFTGSVKLRVSADKDEISTEYEIRVNVHNIDNDLLSWGEIASNTLPSRTDNPVRQKTVQLSDRAYCMIEESDGTYTLRSSDDIEGWQWTTEPMTVGFTPDIASLAASDDSLWILDTDGNLYKLDSSFSQWSATGEKWESVIGGYTGTVVGLRRDNGTLRFAQYPEAGINPVQVPDNFPLSGRSNFVTLTNKWTSSPVAFFIGGRTADGNLCDETWAFDGTEWITLAKGGIPQIEGMSLIPYYNYRPSSSSNAMLEYKVWMALGGRLSDGEFNRTVYISYDNGVNWSEGTETMQLPDEIPAMTDCDNVVISSTKSANLSDLWKKSRTQDRPQRVNYELDGDIITWECPYIYLFGGYSQSGALNTTVWRGVLNRMTFTPII